MGRGHLPLFSPRVQVEIMVLEKRNEELQKTLEEDEQEQLSNNQLVEEYTRLVTENENLILLQNSVKKSISKYRQEQSRAQNESSAVETTVETDSK